MTGAYSKYRIPYYVLPLSKVRSHAAGWIMMSSLSMSSSDRAPTRRSLSKIFKRGLKKNIKWENEKMGLGVNFIKLVHTIFALCPTFEKLFCAIRVWLRGERSPLGAK